MKGYLLLSDGSKFHGTIVGALNNTIGELVFNTGMTGYQEIVTDPSYYGQIVVLTYPMIGNYGVSDVDQSEKVQVRGLVVRDFADLESNWTSKGKFDDYLESNNIVAIKDIDTRQLTHVIRTKGCLTAKIVVNEKNDYVMPTKQPAYEVTTGEIYSLGSGKYHIGVMDYGIKRSILKQLLLKDFRLTVFPADTSADVVKTFNLDGLFLSNGPGDPSLLTESIHELKDLVEAYPTFGICLGHQLISLIYGSITEKLTFGHRGPNHPVKDIKLDRVFMTSQNHGYVVKSDSIPSDLFEITHYNVNDESIEGIRHLSKPIFSVQYHPEASPGPDDSNYLFDQFEEMVKEALC